jgi:hypothetical protein
VRFQVLTAESMKFRDCWDVTPCSLIGVDQCFQRCVLQYAPLKRWSTPLTLHGATFQKTLNFIEVQINHVLLCKGLNCIHMA